MPGVLSCVCIYNSNIKYYISKILFEKVILKYKKDKCYVIIKILQKNVKDIYILLIITNHT